MYGAPADSAALSGIYTHMLRIISRVMILQLMESSQSPLIHQQSMKPVRWVLWAAFSALMLMVGWQVGGEKFQPFPKALYE